MEQQLRQKEIAPLVKTIRREFALPSLPDDIIMDILSMVPAKSIMRFRCVSKLWFGRFKTRDFINKHLKKVVEHNRYNIFLTTLDYNYQSSPPYYRVDSDEVSETSLSDKAVKVDLPIFSSVHDFGTRRTCLGSCNGIFCFSRHSLSGSVTISLWNPSTRLHKEIVYTEPHLGEVVAYGFGYDCKIDDYKLILIFYKQQYSLINGEWFHTFSDIHVYTLGSSSWKTIPGSTTYAIEAETHMSMKLLNGAVHFVAKKVLVTNKQKTVSKAVIVSFDIAEETTKEIQIPSCLLGERYKLWKERVCVLGKDLYFLVHISNVFELWVMKDYGVLDSWTKILSFPELLKNIYIKETLLLFNKNRQILFNCSTEHPHKTKTVLVSYDLGNGTFTFLDTNDAPERFVADTFVESLVSLESTV